MTTVKFEKAGDSIVAVECSGHTGYGVEGEDIVCAAISSIVQTAVLGILQVAAINADYTVKEEDAFLRIALPKTLTPAERRDADTILNTLYLGVYDLYESFSDFIKLEVK